MFSASSSVGKSCPYDTSIPSRLAEASVCLGLIAMSRGETASERLEVAWHNTLAVDPYDQARVGPIKSLRHSLSLVDAPAEGVRREVV